jgi:hypothetical protein
MFPTDWAFPLLVLGYFVVFRPFIPDAFAMLDGSFCPVFC